MDKIKFEEEDKLSRWLKKNQSGIYHISEKLDGVSCLYHYNVDDDKISLFTRGDGKEGSDISYLAKYLKIPKKIPENLYIRGELIMSKNNFQKYADVYANSRNMVSGLVNSKSLREGLGDIDFVTYEIVGEKGEKPSEDFKKLKKYGFRVAQSTTLKTITPETLKKTLQNFKENSDYELDGIIVQSDKEYTRNKSGNPEYAFAFKMNLEENIVESKVIGVEWNLSKRGVLKPRVNLEPTKLQGVTIRYATGKNAKFIQDNGIGPGARIRITRSNEVIPDIVSVIEPAEPDFPDIDYTWNETEVDIIPVEMNEDEFCVKIITDFFKIFNIQYISEQTIKRFREHGLNSVLKILSASEKEISGIDRMGDKIAKKIHSNIHSGLQNITLPKLMAASSLFGHGIGVKKLELLLDEIPNILVFPREDLMNKMLGIKGFSEKTANKIMDNLSIFEDFLNAILPYISFKVEKKKDKIDLRVVFTGFRNKELEERIVEKGGEVLSAVSGKTTHLVVKDKEEKTTKLEKARKLNIPILFEDEFLEIFEGI